MAFKDKKGQKSNKTFLIRCIRLLEYLKRNTDSEHRIKQQDLRDDSNIKPFLGTNETLHNMIVNLTEALNFDSDAIKPEKEWRLVYKSFSDYYGGDDDVPDKKLSSIKDIFFNHVFTNGEMTAIINSLRTSKTVSADQTEKLIKKLYGLMSKHYSEPAYKFDFREFTDSPGLAENITKIQEAISSGYKISFTFNYIDRHGVLVPTRADPYSVSPHYIVSDNGKLYLFGGFDNGDLCDFRIDLMTDIGISGDGSKPVQAKAKHEIRPLPPVMTDEFRVTHFKMSYKNGKIITFKWDNRDPITNELNCTVLYNNFGYNKGFSISDDDVVTVRCSEFGMFIFAMQYSDCVTVLSPGTLRKKIADRVRVLNKKYLQEGSKAIKNPKD